MKKSSKIYHTLKEVSTVEKDLIKYGLSQYVTETREEIANYTRSLSSVRSKKQLAKVMTNILTELAYVRLGVARLCVSMKGC
jgi:hypothetical protein